MPLDMDFKHCLNLMGGVCLRSTFFWRFENVHCCPSLAQTGQSQGRCGEHLQIVGHWLPLSDQGGAMSNPGHLQKGVLPFFVRLRNKPGISGQPIMAFHPHFSAITLSSLIP